MSARKVPSARAARRAVDILAQLGADVLASMVEAAIERLDAATPDADAEHSLGWHRGHAGHLHGALEGDCGIDLEEDDPAEEDDPQGDDRHDPDLEPDGHDACCAGDDHLPPRVRLCAPAVVTRSGRQVTTLGKVRL